MDKFRIDSHKLMFHVDRVGRWLEGGDIYPIYAEISPSGGCNHRCTYCGLDYMGYKPRFLDSGILKARITELGRLGLKSIMYAGEGEPFLHRDMAGIINHTKTSGIDVAVTSNGVLFDVETAAQTLASITWIKFSVNAGTKETYSKIHGTRPDDFVKVMANIKAATDLRNRLSMPATIGMQMVLLPENASEAVTLAIKAKEAGADYLVIKPYSQHPKSITRRYGAIDYREHYNLADELQKISNGRFQVVFRQETMKKLEGGRKPYDRCMALPFWTYIDAGGRVWACSAYLGDERFSLGDINSSSFEDIWTGEQRKKVMAFVSDSLDISGCRDNCRMDEVNRYLSELKNPAPHVNFI